MSGGSRNHALDGLRGLAALAVLALHVWMFTEKSTFDPASLGYFVLGELRLGVILFFVLSGFLLVGPWVAAGLDGRSRPSIARFALRRLARIAPGYWLAMFGALALLHGAGTRWQPSLEELPFFGLFVQNYFEHTRGRLDPPMWSLVVEVTFYALVPLLGWAIARAGRRRSALALCALLVALGWAWTAAAVRGGWPPTATATLPIYLPVFACGIAAAILAHGRRVGPWTSRALVLAGVGAIGANGLWHFGGTNELGHVTRDFLAAAGFAAIVAAAAVRPSRLLGCVPLRWLGSVSYGVYLWHFPVLIWLRQHGQLPADDAIGATLRVLGPTLALATASWLLVERPIVELVGRRVRRRPPQRTTARVRPSSAQASVTI